MKFLKLSINKFALSVEIFVWNAARVKETARREQLYWMLEMDADVRRELFRVPLMVQHQLAAALMKVRAVINTMR
jgi:hypothetical protein